MVNRCMRDPAYLYDFVNDVLCKEDSDVLTEFNTEEHRRRIYREQDREQKYIALLEYLHDIDKKSRDLPKAKKALITMMINYVGMLR